MTRATVSRLAVTGADEAELQSADNPFDEEFAAFLEVFVVVLKKEALALFSAPHSRDTNGASNVATEAIDHGEGAQSFISQCVSFPSMCDAEQCLLFEPIYIS